MRWETGDSLAHRNGAGDPLSISFARGRGAFWQVTVDGLLPDHVVLKTDGAAALTVGDKITLVPSYQDMLVNRWDQLIAVRNGVVEHVWDIPARGCTQ